MNVQIQNSLHPPHQIHSFNVTPRQAIQSRIYAILQHKYGRPDAVSQQKLISLANFLETKLLRLAKSEEDYSDLSDLEFRISFLLKELQRRVACPPSTVEMRGSDGLSALPDSLLTQILLNLPTKDSVKTSVLSKRWRNLWRDVPGLELNSTDFPSFSKDEIKIFIDKFLESNNELHLQKFKVKNDECNIYLTGIGKWIATVINRGAQYLDVDTVEWSITKDLMPLDIYKSKTLVSLKLVNVAMANPEFAVSLPFVKILHLENIFCRKEDPLIIEKLITGCSVLEDLTVYRGLGDNVPVLRVRSQSLKRFRVRFRFEWRILGKEYAVEIDAPGLKYMNFRDDETNRVVAKNLTSLFLIDIDTRFNVGFNNSETKKCTIRDFLTEISSVRHMIISQRTLEVIYIHLKLGPISKFHNLSRLEASFCTLLLQVLPDVLESFPNLKHLTLFLVYLSELEPEDLELTNVPRCLLSSLECVEIREVISGENRARNGKRSMTKVGKHKRKIWMKAVKYIIENAVVLKKLMLCFSPETNKVSHISEELLTFTKRSPKCEVFINLAFH